MNAFSYPIIMQSGDFHENELKDFEKLETETKPDDETYAPNVFFKDNRQEPTIVIRQVDEKKLEAQRKQKEKLMKLAEQFVQVDENPVDDRKTKSIEIVASPEMSASTSTYVRKDTPASLARLQEIKNHKNNKLKPGKFIPRRMQAQPPKPPQQPGAIEAIEERKREMEEEEEDDDDDDELMKPAPKKVKFDMMPPMDADSIRRYEEDLPGADRAVRQQVEAQAQMRGDSVLPPPEQQLSDTPPGPPTPPVSKLMEVKEQAEQLRLQAFLNNINMKSELYLQQKRLRDIALASIQKSFESGENVLETMASYEDLLDFLFVHMPKRNEISVMTPETFEPPQEQIAAQQQQPKAKTDENPFIKLFKQPGQTFDQMFQGSRSKYPLFTRNAYGPMFPQQQQQPPTNEFKEAFNQPSPVQPQSIWDEVCRRGGIGEDECAQMKAREKWIEDSHKEIQEKNKEVDALMH